MQHYKYIHFFWHNDLIFNPRLVKMINNPDYCFSPKEHLFVTPYKRVYEAISSYSNVILWNKDPYSAQMVNYYAPYGDLLILHSVPCWRKALLIRREYQKKVIWRTWGHDAGLRDEKKGSIFRRLINKILNYAKKREVNRFCAVGVSSYYIDLLDIKRYYGDVKTIPLPYPEKTKIRSVDCCSSSNEPLNIMVGHSGYKADNHINILELLKRFKNENICIYLIFSYADSTYMKKVVDYVETNWPQKVKIITEFMPFSEYENFCSKMDIAIFDYVNSYAIGNVSLLFDLRKKLFFNRNGLWHKAFSDKNAPHMCTDELSTISFDEFKKPLVYAKEKYEGLDSDSFEMQLNDWRNLLNNLTEVQKQ